MKRKFKTEDGQIVELNEMEYIKFPFNSKLTLVEEEIKPKEKELIRRVKKND